MTDTLIITEKQPAQIVVSKGLQGPIGATGAQGPQGLQGTPGITGPTGPPGFTNHVVGSLNVDTQVVVGNGGNASLLLSSGAGSYDGILFNVGGVYQWEINYSVGGLNFYDDINARSHLQFFAGALGNATSVFSDQLVIQSSAGQTADLQQWQTNLGSALARLDAAGQMWTGLVSGIDATSSYLSMGGHQTQFINRSAGDVTLSVWGATSQTADLQQWKNSGGTVLANVDKLGNVTSPSTQRTAVVGLGQVVTALSNTTWTPWISAIDYMLQVGTPVVGNIGVWSFDVSPGTWSYRQAVLGQSNCGIYNVDYSNDGTTWTNLATGVDAYSAAVSPVTNTYTGLTLTGYRVYIRVTMTGKNASSSGYYFIPAHATVSLTRTTPA